MLIHMGRDIQALSYKNLILMYLERIAASTSQGGRR
jgi:hypothetical protein